MRFIVDQTQTPNLKVGKVLECLNIHEKLFHFYLSRGSDLLIIFTHMCVCVCAGEGGHPEVHWVFGPTDGSLRLCELKRDASGRLSDHYVDHRAEELRREEGQWVCVLCCVCGLCILWGCDVYHDRRQSCWMNEEMSGRITVTSLPGDSNMEERCKQVVTPWPLTSELQYRGHACTCVP